MKTKECPSCGMDIEADKNVCPICQYEFPASGGFNKWIALLLVLIFLLFLLLGI